MLRCFAALLVLLTPVLAGAEPTRLVLRDDLKEIDGWSAVRVLKEDAGRLTAQQALARLAEFKAPTTPHSNLGPQHGGVWFYLPLTVPASQSGEWVLAIDYPLLQQVEAVQVSGDRIHTPVAMGSFKPRSEWPIASRAPVLQLALAAGQEHALLLRVESSGAMVVPLRLLRPVAYMLAEETSQAFHGLICGVELFLLLYSLTQWAMIRDPMYLAFAVLNAGLMLGFLSLSGMGPQHLWPQNAWLTRSAGLIAVFLGLIALFRFVEIWLRGAGARRRMLVALRLGEAAAAVCLAGFVSGLIDYRSAQSLGVVMGPMPVLFAMSTAFRSARTGSRQAQYMFLGWACYGVGPVTLIALVCGLLPANIWTQNAFQVASLAQMTFFMAVMGLRVQEMRDAAAQSQREHAMLQTMAHTDPLTGLLNRRGLHIALDAALRAAGPQNLTAVFLLDLDGFKPINDRWGHDVGDALLVAVGARLKTLVRTSDAVARLGGDEFVVVVAMLPGDDEAAHLGQKLLDSCAVPIFVKGHECHVGMTIGYALAPLDGSDGAGLLKRADAAMYAGKQSGRHRVQRDAGSDRLPTQGALTAPRPKQDAAEAAAPSQH